MANKTAWLFVLVVLLQTAPSAPIRIGNFARLLPSQDVMGLEQFATARGAKGTPWLLQDLLGRANSLLMYLPAETETAQVRRGRTIGVLRRTGETAWMGGQTLGQYARVVEAGRDFNSITGDADNHRPFSIMGSFSDDELITLETFIRTSPGQVEKSWPISFLIRRDSSNSVTVNLVGPNRVQEVDLVRQGSNWTVTRARKGQV